MTHRPAFRRSRAAALALRLASLTLLFAPASPAQETLDKIAAVVDNEVILMSEVDAQVQFFVLNNRLDPKTPGVREQVLESMITEKLILAKAIEDSIAVTDDEVQQQLDMVIQQRVQQVGSEARLEELYGMPLSRIRREFRDDMRKQLLAQRLRQQKFGTLQVGRFEVEEFYRAYRDSLPRVPEEVQLAHIFMTPRVGDADKAGAKELLTRLRDSILAGADFADLARRYSQDPGSASQGGDLGLVRRGLFVREFESAVFALQEGQLSDIVETQFGFHLIQLQERRGDAVRARHILLRVQTSGSEEDSAKAFLGRLRDRALAGESFGDLAREYSEDKDTKALGGNLGAFELDQLEGDLKAAIVPLKEGDITGPVALTRGSLSGFQIVLLKRRTPAHAMTVEGDYQRLEVLALNAKQFREYQRWVDELKSKIHWQIRL
jgi:peptidyl-prolyl cis-trans isomerase SurA